MTAEATEEVHDLARKLAEACRRAGLEAEQYSSTRVWVHAPKTSHHLAEIITAKPDEDERLLWWWSRDEPLCAVEEIDKAVKLIMHVISVPLGPES